MLPVHETDGALPGALCFWESPPTAEEVVERMNAISKAVDIRLDGIVVQPVDISRWQTGNIERRPRYMRAIKLDPESQPSVDGVVDHVEWQVSKRGLIKPTIVLRNSLNFEGVNVDRCTGINAKFILTNEIVAGRRVRLIRSGDTIPRLLYVFRDGKWKPVKGVAGAT
jgi:NAD-dependent DNA ligase